MLGAWSGAQLGAISLGTIGSIIPGVGTAAGVAAGTVIGACLGNFLGNFASENIEGGYDSWVGRN